MDPGALARRCRWQPVRMPAQEPSGGSVAEVSGGGSATEGAGAAAASVHRRARPDSRAAAFRSSRSLRSWAQSLRKGSRASASSRGWWLGSTGIALVLAICGAICVAARKYRPQDSAGLVQVVGRVSLTPRHSIFVVRAGQRSLLIGTGAQGAPTLLGELTEADQAGDQGRAGRRSVASRSEARGAGSLARALGRRDDAGRRYPPGGRGMIGSLRRARNRMAAAGLIPIAVLLMAAGPGTAGRPGPGASRGISAGTVFGSGAGSDSSLFRARRARPAGAGTRRGTTPLPEPRDALRSLPSVALYGLIWLAPVALMLTAFVRINIVLVLLRQALGSPQVPGNQVLMVLALCSRRW